MEVHISGYLHDTFKILPNKPNVDQLIGLPIKDDIGRIIGVIDSVDRDTNMWFGTVDIEDPTETIAMYSTMEIKAGE